MNSTIRRYRLNPFLRFTTWLVIVSLFAGTVPSFAQSPGEAPSGPGRIGVASHKSGWVCSVVLDETPAAPGESRVGHFAYGNRGSEPIDIPYVHLDAGEGTSLRFLPTDEWTGQLELMAISGIAPASKLEPGEFRQIAFFYKSEGDAASIHCGYTLSDPSEFGWDAAGRLMRPSWASDELWGLSLAILKANLGLTWDEWLARFRSDCDHFLAIGQPIWRVDQLWQLEVDEAMGVDRAIGSLASDIDLVRGGRGMGLSLTRNYGAGLHRRLAKGLFGYGWSGNYDLRVELEDGGGALSLWRGGERIPLFKKEEGKWISTDHRNNKTIEETESEYVLTYRDGTVQRITKSNMRMSSLEDNQGNSLAFTYNEDGMLAKVEHCDGQWLAFAYENGLLVAARDDQGRTTRYAYSEGLLTGKKSADGLVTRYRYLPADGSTTSRALRQIAYADGTTKDFTYDAAGHVVSIALGGKGRRIEVEIVRGAFGSYTLVAPNGGTVAVTAGASGEVLGASNAFGQRVANEYTADGLLAAVTGPTGKRATLTYSKDGRVVKVTDAAGAETAFAYTGDTGNLAMLTDARGNAVNFGYDVLGRGESVSYADGSVERIEYDERGDVVRSYNRRGQGISYAYDKEGNLISKKWDDGRTFTLAYDEKGNCTNACDSVTGAVTMEYDANERLVRIVHPKGRGFEYEYDALGRLVKRTMLGGTGSVSAATDVQRYAYDAFGRLAKMTDGDGKSWVEITYDETTGLPVRQTYGNGTVAVNECDLLGRTKRISHYGKDGSELAFFAYEYDAEGRRVSQTTQEGLEQYTYDTVGQLTDVVYPDGSGEHFAYDAVGNRTESTGILPSGEMKTTYAANALNQYTHAGNAAFAYDADGNLVEKTTPEGGTTRYSYDAENRLTGVANEVQDIAWSCEYDVFGNRVRVLDHGVAKEMLFEQGGLLSAVAEFGADGAVVERHVSLGGVKVADVGAGTRYLHTDGLASARLVTDEAGRAVGRVSYRVFGGGQRLDGRAECDGWVGALGVERDAATGLVFMRNRYYDPEMGRFIQMDPIRLAAGDVNLYRYCINNPGNSIDPFGCSEIGCTQIEVSGFWNAVAQGMRTGAILGAMEGVVEGAIVVAVPEVVIEVAGGGTLTVPVIGSYLLGVMAYAGMRAVQGALVGGLVYGIAYLASISINNGGLNFGGNNPFYGGGGGGGFKPPKGPLKKLIDAVLQFAEKVPLSDAQAEFVGKLLDIFM